MKCSGCIRSSCRIAIEDIGKCNTDPCCRLWRKEKRTSECFLVPKKKIAKRQPSPQPEKIVSIPTPASSSQMKVLIPDVVASHEKVLIPDVVASHEDSFYMRTLPPQLIPFSSPRGQRLLMDCVQMSERIPYFPLIEQFVTQESPPSCAHATIIMVLNSLRVDPNKVWEPPWRWYTENMLESCDGGRKASFPPSPDGISMEEFAYLNECNGLHSSLFYADDTISLDVFREVLKQYVGKPGDALISGKETANARVVTCFSRQHLGQTGSGHYSPIGAYHEEQDMCLILDVARFKYPPYWVSVPQLYEAMTHIEPTTGKRRGFFVLQRAASCEAGNCSSITPLIDSMSNVQDAMEELTNLRRAHCVARTYSHRLRRYFIYEPRKLDSLFHFVRGTDVYDSVCDDNPQDSLWRPHFSLRKELWSLFLIAVSERHLPEAVRRIQNDIVAKNELLSLSRLCATDSPCILMCPKECLSDDACA